MRSTTSRPRRALAVLRGQEMPRPQRSPHTPRRSASGSPASLGRSPQQYSVSPERRWRASPQRSAYSPDAAWAAEEMRREALFKAQLAAKRERDELNQRAHERQRLRDDAAAALRLDDTAARRQNAQRRAEDEAWAQGQVGRAFLIDSKSAGERVEARVGYRQGKWWADYEVFGEPRQRQICVASSPGESLIKLRRILGDDAVVGGSPTTAELEDDTVAFLNAHRLRGYAAFISRTKGFRLVSDLVSTCNPHDSLISTDD